MGFTDCREARLEAFFDCVGVEVWDSTVMVGGHGGTLHATSSHETSRQHQSQRKTLLKVFKLAITPNYLELARQGLISIHCEIIGDSKGGVHMRTFRIHFEEQLTAEYNTSGNSFHVLEVRICSQKWSGVLCNSIRRIRRRWLKKGLVWKQ